MNRPLFRKRGLAGIWLVLLFLLTGLLALNLMSGSVNVPVTQVFRILMGEAADQAAWEKIIWLFRLPKALTAILAGAGLALSGLLMQNLFRNPLAGPGVLGISAGASLGVALVVLWAATGTSPRFIESFGLTGKAVLVAAAGLGASLILGVILLLARRVNNVMTLLLIGILGGFAVNAVVSVLIHFSMPERLQAYIVWTFGSFAAVTWLDLSLLTPIVLVGLAGCQLLSKPLNGLLLGEDYARSMGLRVEAVRLAVIGLTALMTGAITAFCGPVAFIGVAVPHLARLVMNNSDHRRLIPATALLGAMVALAADLLAQLPGSRAVLPLNAVTALIGTPVIIWLLLRRKNIQQSFGG